MDVSVLLAAIENIPVPVHPESETNVTDCETTTSPENVIAFVVLTSNAPVTVEAVVPKVTASVARICSSDSRDAGRVTASAVSTPVFVRPNLSVLVVVMRSSSVSDNLKWLPDASPSNIVDDADDGSIWT